MVQFSNSVERAVANHCEAMEARDHFKNGASSKDHMSRKNFLKRHKSVFVISLTILISLVFWLTIAYFDEGYNRFPVDIVDYFFVVLYALFFPIIPIVTVFLIRRRSSKN